MKGVFIINEKFSPSISVIIPMYNAEKYLAVCLESLLIQTFQNFEVIVVDDCSTDNSVVVAENFLERFDGRLKIISLKENSGTPGLPRNIALEYAGGEYIYFMDSDDFLVDNALEIFYDCAKNYRAEVVCTNCNFTCGEELIPDNLEFVNYNKENFLDEPTFETENLAERIEKFLHFGFEWVTWLKFSRRDFLIDNKITFPASKTSEDGVWTFKILCHAKKFLHIHEPLYVQRLNKNSITRSNRSLEEWISLHTSSLIGNIDALADFMNQIDFFKKNSARLRILDYFISVSLSQMALVKEKLTANQLYELFLQEFSKIKGSSPALSAYLLILAKFYRNELAK